MPAHALPALIQAAASAALPAADAAASAGHGGHELLTLLIWAMLLGVNFWCLRKLLPAAPAGGETGARAARD